MGKPIDTLFLGYFLNFPFSSLYKTSHFEWIQFWKVINFIA